MQPQISTLSADRSLGRAFRVSLDLLLVGLGLACLALGTAVTVSTPWGAKPWDVFHLGLVALTGLSMGRISQLVSVVAVALALLLRGKTITWVTLVNAVVVGFLVDVFLPFMPYVTGIPGLLFLELGVIISGVGMGLYLAPEYGAGPRDSLLLAIVRLSGLSLSSACVIQDLLVVATGFLLGGPVGLGTLVAAVTSGPWVGFFVARIRAAREKVTGDHQRPGSCKA
ncbi:MAG: YczE/YyaS/YitT family protein [Limnochordia bacterium]